MKKLIIVLPLLLVAIGCTQSPPPADPSVIHARSAEWEAALNAGDVEAVVALYESDARLLPPNAEIQTGPDAVRAIFGGMIDAGLTGKLNSMETQVAGDYAYNVGKYILTVGDTVVDTGKYMETWHRGDDGQWRYTNDIWNSDMPVASGGGNAHLVITHEVSDPVKWLAAWRGENSRHQLFEANGAAHVHALQSATNPHLTGLVISVADMDALNAMLSSEEGQAAAAEDGVMADTMKMLTEAE
jgi:ketosteroid isomerase-like protein